MIVNRKIALFTIASGMLAWALIAAPDRKVSVLKKSEELQLGEYQSYITCANDECVERITFPAYHITAERNTP